MSAQIRRRLLQTSMIATAPFLLITCIWCLFLLNAFNPMALAFITSFEVENKTQQPLWVTPVGTISTGGKYVLPQYSMPFPAVPAWRSSDLRIAPGERRRIYYDWDDINFSDIVVRDSTGVLRNLVIDASPPTTGDYYANKADLYSIEFLQALPIAAPATTADLAPGPVQFSFWMLALAGLIAPFLFGWLRQRLRRLSLTQGNNFVHGQLQ